MGNRKMWKFEMGNDARWNWTTQKWECKMEMRNGCGNVR